MPEEGGEEMQTKQGYQDGMNQQGHVKPLQAGRLLDDPPPHRAQGSMGPMRIHKLAEGQGAPRCLRLQKGRTRKARQTIGGNAVLLLLSPIEADYEIHHVSPTRLKREKGEGRVQERGRRARGRVKVSKGSEAWIHQRSH